MPVNLFLLEEMATYLESTTYFERKATLFPNRANRVYRTSLHCTVLPNIPMRNKGCLIMCVAEL